MTTLHPGVGDQRSTLERGGFHLWKLGNERSRESEPCLNPAPPSQDKIGKVYEVEVDASGAAAVTSGCATIRRSKGEI